MKTSALPFLVIWSAGIIFASCQTSALSPTPTPLFSALMIQQGKQLYTSWCATCHGRTRGGIEEARLAFPESDRNCERCHKPYNSPTSLDPSDIFSIGEPPLLYRGTLVAKFNSPQALYDFLRSTMPRWNPGMLGEDEYWAITAFLWQELEGTPAPVETQEHP